MEESKIIELLINNNFRNNQNYVLGDNVWEKDNKKQLQGIFSMFIFFMIFTFGMILLGRGYIFSGIVFYLLAPGLAIFFMNKDNNKKFKSFEYYLDGKFIKYLNK